ncbi:phosphoadenosine phosphosulfate reductase family protein [Sandaracinobacter sp. RS1-74]|uniref:phosphoadenosine phosphosulfate reductase domain-containing protein n=1 Tax=Sandaracinobacteroides sayramensis TaxID=2913411 RepID=UPI001EDBB37E|nr:phosphoadenosine phosphosulfate reductase family protein [Sandaracinobacteroides sayramensis]MCG2841264.1 phosphoadenosine phosphosulfate reductase family protein [Sandaracinobacteroides sayramensis]
MFIPTSPPTGCVLPPAAIDPLVIDAIGRNAWFAFNLSGGKDSTAASHAAMALLDRLGHPRDRRIAIHADLGRAEWTSTPATVERIARHLGIPLIVVRRRAGDMVARWEQRFASGKARYEALATYNLIGPWSSSSLRFCTSELKVQVIGRELVRRFRGETIVCVIGLRREESLARRSTPVSGLDERFAKPGNVAGTRVLDWHPLVDWTAADVFGAHDAHGLPLHEAYCRYGSTRLSCAFCVLASRHDLRAAARAARNVGLYRHLVAIEADSTFSFQPARWLADIAPHLLSDGLRADLVRARADAQARRRIEAAMPAGLRFVKGWPPRVPTPQEADRIAAARAPILARHHLENRFPDGPAVSARFADLLDLKAARGR